MIVEVIATYGRHLLVRDAAGTDRMARPFGRQLQIVCGDRVECEARGDELLASRILPRTTFIRRSTLKGRSEPLAANLTQMAVVVALVPVPDLFMVDRYLCAAECAGLAALVVVNKSDLPGTAELLQALQPIAAAGYTVLESCALQTDANRLQQALPGHTTMLVGQSGVGKSSLTGNLASGAEQIAIGELVRDEEGRHTTTASRLYDCPAGGRIIDSPGVRDFAPAIDDLEATTLGFREVALLAPQCHFQDCRHMQEPRCAVQDAVAAGSMDARRYESYRRLRRLYDQLWDKRPQRERAARR